MRLITTTTAILGLASAHGYRWTSRWTSGVIWSAPGGDGGSPCLTWTALGLERVQAADDEAEALPSPGAPFTTAQFRAWRKYVDPAATRGDLAATGYVASCEATKSKQGDNEGGGGGKDAKVRTTVIGYVWGRKDTGAFKDTEEIECYRRTALGHAVRCKETKPHEHDDKGDVTGGEGSLKRRTARGYRRTVIGYVLSSSLLREDEGELDCYRLAVTGYAVPCKETKPKHDEYGDEEAGKGGTESEEEEKYSSDDADDADDDGDEYGEDDDYDYDDEGDSYAPNKDAT